MANLSLFFGRQQISRAVAAALDAQDATLSASALNALSANATLTADSASLSASAAVAVTAALGPLTFLGHEVHSSLALSGSSVTKTLNEVTWGNARGSIGTSSGHAYCEFTINSLISASYGWVGIGTSAAILNDLIGLGTTAWAYHAASGNRLHNFVSNGYGATYGQGDVIGVGLQFSGSTGTLTFYKNGVSQGAAYTNIPAGTYYPMLSLWRATDRITLNDGGSGFAYPIPAGARAWRTFFADGATLASSATASISASANLLADDALLEAAADSSGDAAAELDAVAADATLSAAAELSISASADLAAEASLSATAAVSVTVQADLTAEDARLSASAGEDAVSAAADVTAADAALSAAAELALSAAADITADGATLSAMGSVDIAAALGITADNAILVATAQDFGARSAALDIAADDAWLVSTAAINEIPPDAPGFIDTVLSGRGRASTSLSGRGRVATSLGPTRS